MDFFRYQNDRGTRALDSRALKSWKSISKAEKATRATKEQARRDKEREKEKMEVDSEPSTSASSAPADLSIPPPPSPPPAAGGATSTNGSGGGAEGGEGDVVMASVDSGAAAAPSELPEEDALPEDASQVIYINNLNEKIKLNVMKQSLKTLFRQYGKVLDVTAHKSIRMRGQAFVTVDSKKAAALAVKEVKGFPLYGKPMQLAFARTKSDALVKAVDPEQFDEHKAERLIRKKISRRDNPLRRKWQTQKEAEKKAAALAPISTDPSSSSTSITATPAARRIVQMPDEYLPPNKILFVQNLPDETTKEMLETLFGPYPNLIEVRTIPGRKNIAFVEYADDGSSGVARDALHNTKVFGGDLKLKVTFAKQ